MTRKKGRGNRNEGGAGCGLNLHQERRTRELSDLTISDIHGGDGSDETFQRRDEYERLCEDSPNLVSMRTEIGEILHGKGYLTTERF